MMHADLIDQDDFRERLQALGFSVPPDSTPEQACEYAVRGLSPERAQALRRLVEDMLGTNQPKLQEIVALMEANLEEPIDLDELAVYVNVSRRQLERLFQKYLHCSPSRYYLKLRLIRARQLLKQTSMSIIEVASVCGFVSTPHFSKCYREYFGIPPRDERQGQPLGQPVVLMPIPQDLALMPNSSALSALSQAQGESTFASVRI